MANLTDIEKLIAVEEEGIEAVVLGRALYEGTLDFKVALAKADGA